jgi:flavin prenyltransferase
MKRRRVVVGISGASGARIGLRVAELLNVECCADVHLVVSKPAESTLAHEVGEEAFSLLERSVACRHEIDEIGASIASGSFETAGMLVTPCSMRTVSAIAAGISDNLLVRAADVHLKARRRLVLVVRESPLHLGHLRAMAAATEYGAIIAPATPAFYLNPASVMDVIDQIARNAIDLLRLGIPSLSRSWSGLHGASEVKYS